MRHAIAGRRLGRSSGHRKLLYRNLVRDLLINERIKTTEAKAKEVKGLTEKIITLGKKGTLHHRRQALAFVPDKSVVDKVFEELSERYKGRSGGYCRIIKAGLRKGDAAAVDILELVT